MGDIIIGCSGWSYSDPSEKGGWTGAFYPDSKTRRLAYYSKFFKTVEMDSTFYEKFYSHMTKGTFYGMVKATPENFQFSVKVPETVTIKSADLYAISNDMFVEHWDVVEVTDFPNRRISEV